MKKLLIVTTILLGSIHAQGQLKSPNWKEWFRQKKTQRKYLQVQVAQLRLYLGYLKKGYEIADRGFTMIGGIRNGALSLDKNYLRSLSEVSNLALVHPRTRKALELQQQLSTDLRRFYQACQDDEHLTTQEVEYIKQACSSLLSKCGDTLDEFDLLSVSYEMEMEEAERLLRLERLYDSVQECYVFSQQFIHRTLLLSRQRALEKQQIRYYGDLTL